MKDFNFTRDIIAPAIGALVAIFLFSGCGTTEVVRTESYSEPYYPYYGSVAPGPDVVLENNLAGPGFVVVERNGHRHYRHSSYHHGHHHR